MSYILSVSDVQNQGFTVDAGYAELDVQEAIDITEEYFEKICDVWFESRAQERLYDGTGGQLLVLDVPIISLSKVETRSLGQSWYPYTDIENNFAVYIDPGYPKIQILNQGIGGPACFPKGPHTVRLTGSFGYNAVPAPIKRAALELAPIYLGTIISFEPQDRLKKLMYYEEETETARYRIAESMTTGKLTGVASVDRVLARYKRKGSVSHG